MWDVEYYSMCVLEKLFACAPAFILKASLNTLWLDIYRLVTHPHVWLRVVSNRLLGQYFQAIQANGGKIQERSFLGEKGRTFNLAKRLCWMLDGPEEKMPEALQIQLLKNLLFLSITLYHQPSLAATALARLLQKKRRRIAKQNGSLNTEEEDNGDQEESNDEDEDEDDQDGENEDEENEDMEVNESEMKRDEVAKGKEATEGEHKALHWLFRRLSFLARKPGNQRVHPHPH